MTSVFESWENSVCHAPLQILLSVRCTSIKILNYSCSLIVKLQHFLDKMEKINYKDTRDNYSRREFIQSDVCFVDKFSSHKFD
jgi:hypothetical protein